ncbi:DUF3006 family protein [Halobaculum sp. MBLA0147]|uniref:DUF3006 family protein n=1 Tax=Halobaculum sp. MBLA0147 TaxID=3079934 RepID=UPI0035260855
MGDDTLPEGTHSAVVDRFEGDTAVLEVTVGEERRQSTGGDDLRQWTVARETLPTAARHQDAVVTLAVDGTGQVEIAYDETTTTERTEAMQDRFDRLSRRLDEDDG